MGNSSTKWLWTVCFVALGADAAQAALPTDPNPPKIIVTIPGPFECRNPTVPIYLGPKVVDDQDSFPSVTIQNRIAGDAPGYPSNTDPDNYPWGSRNVIITATDHDTSTQPGSSTMTVPIVVRDTRPPAINAGQNPNTECSSPAGAPALGYFCEDFCDTTWNPTGACSNPNTQQSASCVAVKQTCINGCDQNAWTAGQVVLSRPIVTDLCDPAPIYRMSTAPSVYPIGYTPITVTGIDKYGNAQSANIMVNVHDTTPPVFASGVTPYYVQSTATVPNANCVGAGGTGTPVVLPRPIAHDLCTPDTSLTYTWTGTLAGGATQPETASQTVCLPNGINRMQSNVRDTKGNLTQSATFAVSVQAGAFALNVVVGGGSPAGWVPTGSVSATATNSVANVTWYLVGAAQPTMTLSGNHNQNVIAAFNGANAEGSYCPLYLSATDGTNQGGSSAICFGIDTTAPTYTFTSVPLASTQPNGQTPVFSHGQRLPLQITAQDAAGSLPSGIGHVSVTLTTPTNGNQLIYDAQYCTNTTTSLTTCAPSHFVAGCNQNNPLGGCQCTTIGSNGECTTDGRLDLSTLSNGAYTMNIVVKDMAGNSMSGAYPFIITDLPGSVVNANGLVAMLAQDIASGAANTALLTSAKNQLQAASAVFLESPGMSFLLEQQAYNNITSALATATNQAFLNTRGPYYQQAIAQFVFGEVRAIYNQTAAENLGIWAFIAKDPNFKGATVQERYKARYFITDRGWNANPPASLRDFAVNSPNTLLLAWTALSQADQSMRSNNTSAALSSAMGAFDTMATLFQDQTFATLYSYAGRTLHTVTVPDPNGTSATTTAPEAYFRGSSASHFGAEIALTLSNQMTRFVTLVQNTNNVAPGIISATVLNTILDANTRIANFATAVTQVQSSKWNVSFGNRGLTQQVYLNAIAALQDLHNIASSVIYTRYWQTGISLTLAEVINFSMYEGPTALTCILWGLDSDGNNNNVWSGCSAPVGLPPAPGAPAILDYNGQPRANEVLDPTAQVAECRYANMTYALADGRLSNPNNAQGALDLFLNSQCLIVQLYNKYYGNKQYFTTDTALNPNYPLDANTAFNCGAPHTYTQNDVINECGACAVFGGTTAPCLPGGGCDNTCDGVDEDCNGVIDNDVVNPNCGCPGLDPNYTCPCASKGSCILGQTLPCVPGAPPSTQDNACQKVDLNCNGVGNENWTAVSCGIGGCMSYSTCTEGVPASCVPKTASAEVCNGVDDNCNVLIDEGEDADQDKFACNPNATGCTEQPSPSANFHPCAGNLDPNGNFLNNWDCNDNDPSIFPGNPEVCDGKDNNCNGVVDEGVLNDCGNCSASCVSTALGGPGAPFGPTSTNSSNVGLVTNANNPNQQPPGSLTLNQMTYNNQAWIANDYYGTVSKIDTTSGKEVARYCTAIKNGVGASDTRAEPTTCGICASGDASASNVYTTAGCNRGSRTSVDQAGNVYIGNRAFNYQGVYTKIANLTANCVDVNGDGTIETSRDVNGNGVIDMGVATSNPNLQEFFGEADECILWTRKPTYWDVGGNPQCSTLLTSNTCGASNNRCRWTGNCTKGLSWSSATNVCKAGNSNTTTCGNMPECTYLPVCFASALGAPANCGNYIDQTTCQTNNCTWGQCAPVQCATIGDQGTCQGSNPNSNLNGPYCTWVSNCQDMGQGYILPRAMAADGNNAVWVGAFNLSGFFQVNAQNGNVLRFVSLSNVPYDPHGVVKYNNTIYPYGASIDSHGILWAPNYCCGSPILGSLNTRTTSVAYLPDPNASAIINPNASDVAASEWAWGSVGNANSVHTHVGSLVGDATNTKRPPGSYGVAIDGKYGVWVGGYNGGSPPGYAGARYDVTHDKWMLAIPPTVPNGTSTSLYNTTSKWYNAAGDGRGVTVDAMGRAWIAQHGWGYWGNSDAYGRVTAFDGYGGLFAGNANANVVVLGGNVPADFYLGIMQGGGACPNCVAPLGNTNPYANINIGVGLGPDGKVWINNEWTGNLAVVDPNNPTGPISFYPVGGWPYTYSDFTGSLLRTFTAPQGSYTEIVSACYGFQVQSWSDLVWSGFAATGPVSDPRTLTGLQAHIRLANALTTTDSMGNPVDPIANSAWSYWIPGDVTDPNNGSKPLYWGLVPTAGVPTSGPCTYLDPNQLHQLPVQVPAVWDPNHPPANGFPTTGCVDLTANSSPTNVNAYQLGQTFTPKGSSQVLNVTYVQIEIRLLSDSTNTYVPDLSTFKLVRSCPQL